MLFKGEGKQLGSSLDQQGAGRGGGSHSRWENSMKGRGGNGELEARQQGQVAEGAP